MTNLSKELCEICGIEPEIIEDYDSNEYEIYPDFEQPENFVKLYGLPVKIGSNEPAETIAHILSGRFHIFDVEDFISALYKYLSGYNRYGAQIIQTLRAEEGKYEG